MNKEELVVADQAVKEYINQNKLRPMFMELTRELLLKKPDDPIGHLIAYLDKRTRKQIVCIQGYDDADRTRLANIVANKFNYKLIELTAIFEKQDYHFQGDKLINEKVCDELKAVEAIFKGVIISGYPNNLVQLDHLQKCGVLPDRYFWLPADGAKLAAKYGESRSPQDVQKLLERNRMEHREVAQSLGEMLDQLPGAVEEASEKLSCTLSIKARKSLPYEAARAIFVHPPYLQPPGLQKVLDRFSLHHISVGRSLQRLSKQPQFSEYVGKYIRKNGHLSREIELALIENEARTSAAKNKGFILSGWPTHSSSLPFLKEKFLAPHLIFIFELPAGACLNNLASLAPGDPLIFPVCPKPDPETFKQQLSTYNEMVEQLKEQASVQVLPWGETDKQVAKTYENLIENPKFYQ